MPALTIPTRTPRIEQAEERLARGESPREVAKALAKEWGLKPRQARRYVGLALKRWHEESKESREAKRAHYREMLHDLYHRALAKSRMLVSARGDKYTYPDPDVKAALLALDNLCRLDGVYEQPGGVSVTVVSGDAVKALSEFFVGSPPEEVIDVAPSSESEG